MRPCPQCSKPVGNWMKVCPGCQASLSSQAPLTLPRPPTSTAPVPIGGADLKLQMEYVTQANAAHDQYLLRVGAGLAICLWLALGLGVWMVSTSMVLALITLFVTVMLALMLLAKFWG